MDPVCGTTGEEATLDNRARAVFASEEWLSRLVAEEFCVQTVACGVGGELNGYRAELLCADDGLGNGLGLVDSGSLKYMVSSIGMVEVLT